MDLDLERHQGQWRALGCEPQDRGASENFPRGEERELRIGARKQIRQQELEERLLLRKNPELHLCVGGEARLLLRDLEGPLQTTELVYESNLLRVTAGPDPSLRHGVDLVRRLLPGLGHPLEEGAVARLQDPTKLLPLLGDR